jgi:hypothetical protein
MSRIAISNVSSEDQKFHSAGILLEDQSVVLRGVTARLLALNVEIISLGASTGREALYRPLTLVCRFRNSTLSGGVVISLQHAT